MPIHYVLRLFLSPRTTFGYVPSFLTVLLDGNKTGVNFYKTL